ncbi:MAG: ATP-binding protein [Alcanivorax sp.]|jgi:MoxR-like ATPase|uniref:ATP-binding protein n=1 Tax=Alcanivorax sp. TaxID=1872427 RepID=UPI00243D4905
MTPLELKEYLTGLIENRVNLSAMIWGPPGIGKSSLVQQIAQAHELDFVDVRLSQLAPTDLRGLPVPENGITYWAPPEFLPRKGSGILFMDEINMAPPAMQGVAQQLILDRRVGNYQLPENWFIWAAGNRKVDRASVFDMPAPLANRFMHFEVGPCIDSFKRYAFQRELSQSIIGFLAFRQDLLHKILPDEMAWPSPRSWEMAAQLHSAGLDIEPAVGLSAAAEFYAYVDIAEKIPDILSIVSGKKSPEFPDDISLRYATVMSLVAQSRTVEATLNALRWLVDKASAEWVQLYAADAFPLLRESNLMADLQQSILQEEKLKNFLLDYAQMMAS